MKSVKLLCLATLCFLCYITRSLSPACASDISTVPLKEWNQSSDKPDSMLRGDSKRDTKLEMIGSLSCELGKLFLTAVTTIQTSKERKELIDKADGLLKELKNLGTQSESNNLMFLGLRGDTIPSLKSWEKYNNQEKFILRARWTKEKIEAVIKAIKEKEGLPEFVDTLPPIEKDFPLLRNDLRGIPLQGRDLQNTDLSKLYLQGGNLSGTKLVGADLQGSDLRDTHMENAILLSANLEGARLTAAILQSTDFFGANLKKTRLWWNNLKRADLRLANLQDADLLFATFDSTYLWGVDLGAAKNIRYIIWGSKIEPRYIIGEEVDTDTIKIDSLKQEIYRRAAITYRDLKTFYKKELMDDVSSEFHYRENVVITKRYLGTKSKPLNYLWGVFRRLFLEYTYGYGSRPIWLLRDSSIIIILFLLIFALLTIPRRTKSGIYFVQPGRRGEKEKLLTLRKGRLFFDCFYFSLLSFVTFGYGALQPRQWLQFFRLQPLEFKPVRWARIFVGIEAAIGIWIFALLVTVLFGRG